MRFLNEITIIYYDNLYFVNSKPQKLFRYISDSIPDIYGVFGWFQLQAGDSIVKMESATYIYS